MCGIIISILYVAIHVLYITDLQDILSLCIPKFKCLNLLQNADIWRKKRTITKKEQLSFIYQSGSLHFLNINSLRYNVIQLLETSGK